MALRLVLGGRGADPEVWETFEAGRWQAMERVATLLGLDAESPALRMAGRAAVSAIDEATVFWLRNGEPFALEVIVDYLVGQIASGLRAATIIDPGLDVDDAVRALGGQ